MSALNNISEKQTALLEIVLKEILAEQQQIEKKLQSQENCIAQLTNSVENFGNKLEKITIIPPPISTKSMEEIVRKGMMDMHHIVLNQPKNVIRKFQLLLFPEQDASLFYKIVFGRWLIVLAIMAGVNFLFQFALHWSDNSKEIRLEQLKNEPVIKAWNLFYYQQNREGKRKMDSAYVKSLVKHK